MVLKVVYDRPSWGQTLGGQALGADGVEKRIDALAAALHGKMTLEDLAEIDFSYSPPYSSANDPRTSRRLPGSTISAATRRWSARGRCRKLPACSGPAGSSGSPGPCGAAGSAGRSPPPRSPGRAQPQPSPRPRTSAARCTSRWTSCGSVWTRCRGTGPSRCTAARVSAHLATRILIENGWKNVRNITGGFVAMTALGGFDFEN